MRAYATEAAQQNYKLAIGQPTPETHPHLLKAGELTRGIQNGEYVARRTKLAKSLPDGGVAVFQAASLKYRSGPVFYEFHQDPDFFYLTGFLEPDAVGVVEKTGPDGEHIFHLFVRPKDEHSEAWEGPRSGIEGAYEVFGADNAGDFEHFHSHLESIMKRASAVYTDVSSKSDSLKPTLSGMLNKIKGATKLFDRVQSLKPKMHMLRSFKSFAEITNMRSAGRISGRAFNETMERRWKSEADLWAFLEYQFRMGGCEKSAYVPVVGGGDNALKIHYTKNDKLLRDGDLVLVDAGGSYGGYVTDITRTWPVNGKFSDAQRDLYELVLGVQRKCVGLCREDAKLSLDQLHSIAEEELLAGLRSLGFNIGTRDMRSTLFPHHLGHYVGIDVHDCNAYGRNSHLKVGQCVTIEPGIYVPRDNKYPLAFQGIGIRIEDSVCVDDTSPIVLSANAAKEVADIEALAAE
ncbi:hypothetical protein H072_4047 [Dactylellina haptotyla CBS 200.50]|uniref:Xaa-Pro aminopeptidase n=1 Tax=Dactylellina haptotyla (strain CBS 200.50) TaxID=1284197 RepID=S8BRE3_DACHA|nr:hypothetical protein H072_4047 [Dactylellina haptotyla CBS 200.50]